MKIVLVTVSDETKLKLPANSYDIFLFNTNEPYNHISLPLINLAPCIILPTVKLFASAVTFKVTDCPAAENESESKVTLSV